MSDRLCEHKVNFILEIQDNYDFPSFMRQVRKLLGKTIEEVSKDTKIPTRTLNRFEAGGFVGLPKDRITKLCKYYKLPAREMSKKCKEYLAVKSLDESRRHVVL